jgi:rhodanese-related sulfurtransferase
MNFADEMMNTDRFIRSLIDQNHRGLSPADTQKACAMGAVLLDIREAYNTDYKRFDVPEFILIPLSEEAERRNEIPADRWLVISDVSGNMAPDFCRELIKAGYTQVCVLAGGFVAWEREELPVLTDTNQAFTGSCVCQLKQRNLKK